MKFQVELVKVLNQNLSLKEVEEVVVLQEQFWVELTKEIVFKKVKDKVQSKAPHLEVEGEEEIPLGNHLLFNIQNQLMKDKQKNQNH